MVLEHIVFATALGGSIVASAYDLKTTEVPNWVFYVMMAVGIPVALLKFVLEADFNGFMVSGITGLSLLGFGYMMYRMGQWGGADMVLLALIGFFMPSLSTYLGPIGFPFGISFLLNLFIVGAVYMVAYAVVFAAKQKDVKEKFFAEMKASSKMIVLLSVAVLVVMSGLTFYLNSVIGDAFTQMEMVKFIAVPFVLLVVFVIVYKFARSVENFGFKKKIHVSQLRTGDMLMSERKLIGVTEQQVAKIKRSRVKYVWIKEGVRFVPAFPLALIFTFYFGDAINFISALF